MADHSSDSSSPPSSPGPAAPDYDLDLRLTLDSDQLKLLLDPTRMRIVDLLSERAATTSQLADVLGRPKGTIGHHTKALEAAGLIRVVRTGKVRAIEERYYGRTARLFILGDFQQAGLSLGTFLDESYAELRESATAPWPGGVAHLATARYARIPHERAEEWATRLSALVDEFAAQERGGDTTYGVLVGLFATDRPGFS